MRCALVLSPCRLQLSGSVALLLLLSAASVRVTGQQSLTRQAASQVIQRYSTFAGTTSIRLCNPAQTVEAGVREGIWRQEGFGGLQPTDTGRQYFTRFDGFPEYRAYVTVPVTPEIVAVTGITDQERNVKLVLFNWRYAALPEVVARYTCQGNQPHQGRAFLRLYDDGWRVDDLELTEAARTPFAGVPESVIRRETLVPHLLTPAPAAVIAQNDSNIDCAEGSLRGAGHSLLFDWSDVSVPGHNVEYELWVIGATAINPIVHVTVQESSYEETSCGSFVADLNLQGWQWRVRAKWADQSGPWSDGGVFHFAPCRLADGTPCRTQ